ncbi:RNA polymerase sigma factor [Candidatus Eisenbacteria bacterium]|uniref:RNA polymerase sigma factor n=1 Tax=Eiseniibacteriota bacterium TaxID=2212470 RepID=A0ABV6YIQ1_UNCEI
MAARLADSIRQESLTPSLIASLRRGEAAAGALLNDVYRQAMLRYCWGYLGTLDDAEDAVQEIFCKVLQGKSVPDNFRAWLYKVARNHCLDLIKMRGRRRDNRRLPTKTQPDGGLTGDLSRLVRRELHSRLGHLLDALSPDQREVLRLRYAENLSRADIAEVLDLPESIVKSRLYEGLVKLRQHASLMADS